MIGSEWINKHTNHRACIVAIPLLAVFELEYENDDVANQRWSAGELYKHWIRTDMILEEE